MVQYAWDNNQYGQIGNGTFSAQIVPPVQVTGVTSALMVATGWAHGIAVRSDRTVLSWGKNSNGQLGNGGTVNQSSPSQVTGVQITSTPTFSPDSGTFSLPQNVTITCATPGAVIRYTVNGNDPTATDSSITSASTVNVDRSLTLKAKAFKEGFGASPVKVATYTIVAPPIRSTTHATSYTNITSISSIASLTLQAGITGRRRSALVARLSLFAGIANELRRECCFLR